MPDAAARMVSPILSIRSTLSRPLRFPWLRWCSIGVLLLSIAFLTISVFAYNYHPALAASLVPALIVALCLAVFLNVYTLWHLRREHKSEDQAFRYTDREFSSIFQNVLDGILIVNTEATCLDANPAAAAILRCRLNEVVGQNITRFFSDPDAFLKGWKVFLRNRTSRGHVSLVAGDGADLFVDFTAAADYLPGRHVLVICDVTERTQTEASLRESEARFQEMANNIAEIFWRMDARTQEVTYVNPAYATITGHDIETLRSNPSFYRELIHPEDRVRVLSRLQETLTTGSFDEEFRFTRADGTVRWIWAKGFPVPSDGETQRLVGTAQDITSRKQAEMKISEQLDTVEAARAEAEALRKATLALSQNLAMDSVLDTLLNCINDLVPFDKAAVLFVEDGAELMVAREVPRSTPPEAGTTFPASSCLFLEQILFERKSWLIHDLSKEAELKKAKPLCQLRSWLGVPLIAGGHVLGILSLGKNAPYIYKPEHLRLAKSLAIPAAVAIQNARTHERAEIYAAELEVRLRAQTMDVTRDSP
jgi:PAS domain S-box-containing protein